MVLGKLDNNVQKKKKMACYFSSYTKYQLKINKRLKYETRN